MMHVIDGLHSLFVLLLKHVWPTMRATPMVKVMHTKYAGVPASYFHNKTDEEPWLAATCRTTQLVLVSNFLLC